MGEKPLLTEVKAKTIHAGNNMQKGSTSVKKFDSLAAPKDVSYLTINLRLSQDTRPAITGQWCRRKRACWKKKTGLCCWHTTCLFKRGSVVFGETTLMTLRSECVCLLEGVGANQKQIVLATEMKSCSSAGTEASFVCSLHRSLDVVSGRDRVFGVGVRRRRKEKIYKATRK